MGTDTSRCLLPVPVKSRPPGLRLGLWPAPPTHRPRIAACANCSVARLSACSVAEERTHASSAACEHSGATSSLVSVESRQGKCVLPSAIAASTAPNATSPLSFSMPSDGAKSTSLILAVSRSTPSTSTTCEDCVGVAIEPQISEGALLLLSLGLARLKLEPLRLSSGDAGGFRLGSHVADKGRGPRFDSGVPDTDGLRLGSGDADTGRAPCLSSGTLERLGCTREGEGEAPPAKFCTGNASTWSDLARGLLGDGLAGTREGSDLSEVVRFCSASPANVRI
eukprot:scaffold39923_cov64-Phaeocystis_antarctica.AAC.4